MSNSLRMNDRSPSKSHASAVSYAETSLGRACGKVILLGEHAVVFGIPAVALGIDRGAQARATALPVGAAASILYVCGWGIEVVEGNRDLDLARAFTSVLNATRERQIAAGRAPIGAVRVDAQADLPPGGGLGCSAALGVAVARALDPSIGDAEAAERAMAWERVFHGNPSGVDAAVAASGGCVLFEKGQGIEAVRVRGGITLCIGHTGIASSTKAMVEAVAKLRAQSPARVDDVFDEIRALTRSARVALETGDRYALGKLMDRNQALLDSIGVSTGEIDRMCTLARGAGAVGAKLTGAGGGGCVVALVTTQAATEAVLSAWRAAGYDGFATKVAMPEPKGASMAESEAAP